MEELIRIAEKHHEGVFKVNERLERMIKNGMDKGMAIEVLKRMYQDRELRIKAMGLRK